MQLFRFNYLGANSVLNLQISVFIYLFIIGQSWGKGDVCVCLVIISYCEFFSLTIFLPFFETLKASVKSFVMLPVFLQGSLSFIFI